MEALVTVITTIQKPTQCVQELMTHLEKREARAVVIGDKKGPSSFESTQADFYSLEQQSTLPFRLAALLPTGHYARKNLGYLIAFSRSAACIYETDDDNAPLPSWAPRELQVSAQKATSRPWLNVYRLFTEELIWPRGFPLELICSPESYAHDHTLPSERVIAPIQQGLANGSPDVDAIWRLILDQEFAFKEGPSVWLPPQTYCPFNSQTTWWWPEAYPLMYLPSFCSFRMTDIWRSFVAQRCLWELGYGMVFHGAEVTQLRNEHNLLRDFSDEVSGYLQNDRIVALLNNCKLSPGPDHVADNLRLCYQALINASVIPGSELPLVDAWIEDLKAIL
ncbi:STELLO glycosyltransferase family protein [Roseimicrobium sp. ORNL1]|uniref:STELLO glycosyltransferase family protein n=1 Tax=Roseimicrobium sp. ORNL1 TaxID=2711231 RepID=UPI0013E1D87B|nr:STELLO glycosyltransferase family protein [Roseimicrobium sp. ORNL1]QIF04480.1 DUF288 domain-containing protein [Roseimicrobium sp. ORNL1]